ncbi:MAG: sugar transferase [Lachnospiraceae bacterium]|nr:sugar transferase [Lachnospiraceae bacterium]
MDIVGNKSLISNEEETAAAILRERNLEHKNQISAPVIPKKTFYARHGKRILDICISLPIFLLLLPINLILGICTFFDVGAPIFYKQTRVGKDGKYFTLVKFRNMNNKTDADGKLLPPAQRVTKFGKIMRKLSLDELMNFWSVLKGDMSIIGPRPQPVFIYERMCDRHKMRTAVRPGLECPRVIHVEGEEICKFQQTFENDVWYVEHVSLFQDIRMMLLLVKMVFSMEKRGNQAAGKGVSYFVGYTKEGIAIGMNSYREMTQNGADI